MSCAVVQLTGDALRGVESNLVPHALMAAMPKTVCLGRQRPKARPQALRLSCYFDEAMAALALPASTNYRAKAAQSIARMYLNDQYGDCVFAGKAHDLGVWSANDPDSDGIILATDAEIKKQYFDYTGGADNGANIADVLDIMKAKGFLAGGKYYKIDGYVSVDWTKQNLVKATQALFGASSIGINLPREWTSAAVWDVTNTPIVGGHDVTPIDYDDKGVYVASWGRTYLITWAAFTSRKWLEEYYAILAPSWYNKDSLAPSGVSVTTLKDDLTKLSGGTIPDVPDPNNEPPLDWFA